MTAKPLYGDPEANAPVWSKYAVLFGSQTATIPVGNAAFSLNDPTGSPAVSGQWDAIGALDSDTPFDGGAESIDSSDHTAAGHGVYATTYKNQKETRTFTAKESTLLTLGILYNTDGVTESGGNLSGTLKRRDPTEKFRVGFHRENADKCERYISKNLAYIDSITRNWGNDEATYSVTVVISPNSDDELYTYYLGDKLDDESSSSSSSSSS